MTKEEARKKVSLLRHCLEDYEDFPLYIHDEDLTALDMAISALKGGWIPVEERKPEEAYPCYVTVEEDDIYGEPYSEIYPEFVGYDGETWNNSDGEPIPLEVIAWQRKPEPYKKGE